MGKKKMTKIVLSMMMVVLLMGMIQGRALAASSSYLSMIQFMSITDSTLIAGESSSINVQLFQNYLATLQYSGSVTATITDSNENQKSYSVSGSQGYYTISNVILDIPGSYTLKITSVSPNTGSATATITVEKAVAIVTGSLAINTNNFMTIKLTDFVGNPLARSSVTLDGTEVGLATQTYTTLIDGTVTFFMTPSVYGTVKIVHAGHVIGTIPVLQAYTQNDRIGGTAEDNVALSVTIAKSGWVERASTVILVRDDQFSDAMAAVPLSKKLDAPILMTDSAALDKRTLAEIQRLGANHVYIVGGTLAISQTIENSLNTPWMTTTRIAGQQGYDTAALISSYVGIDATYTVYIANGHAIPDAIAASAFAAEQGSPILLTDRNSLPASTIQALNDLKVNKVVLLGGTAVIGASVEAELSSKYLVNRWGGYDRYDTQNIVFQNLLNTTNPQSPLYFTSGLVRQDDVSSGKPKADALLTAALAAKTGGFVAMIPQTSLPSSLNYFLLFNKGYIIKTAVVGNNGSISQNLEQQLEQILSR